MARYVVEPRGPFSLEEARRSLTGFGPAAHAAESRTGHLHVAVVPDGSDVAGGACVRADGGTVTIDTFGAADPDATRRQVERMLSLDVDARGFAAVAERDPVVGAPPRSPSRLAAGELRVAVRGGHVVPVVAAHAEDAGRGDQAPPPGRAR